MILFWRFPSVSSILFQRGCVAFHVHSSWLKRFLHGCVTLLNTSQPIAISSITFCWLGTSTFGDRGSPIQLWKPYSSQCHTLGFSIWERDCLCHDHSHSRGYVSNTNGYYNNCVKEIVSPTTRAYLTILVRNDVRRHQSLILVLNIAQTRNPPIRAITG